MSAMVAVPMIRRLLRPARVLASAFAAACLLVGSGHAQSNGAPGNGELKAHALDATIGQPARGVAIEVFDVSADPPRKVAAATTDDDGRADLIVGRPIAVGRYELRFA